jgi:hypothetical protein
LSRIAIRYDQTQSIGPLKSVNCLSINCHNKAAKADLVILVEKIDTEITFNACVTSNWSGSGNTWSVGGGWFGETRTSLGGSIGNRDGGSGEDDSGELHVNISC